mmetsp:Transcript_6630/g.8769  ORF Transcript_6630/g.8769 Transcript_6630/m.8769 type:complete len:304 (+) Transcript_6630:2-913(+)
MCCRTNFQFLFQECMGGGNLGLNLCSDNSTAEPLHTLKWYVVYNTESDPECVQECEIGSDCDDWSQYHEELYDSYTECCQFHLWWIEGISCSSLPGEANSNGTEPGPKLFVDFDSGSCIKDCEPGTEGCAEAPPSIKLYDDIESCCELGQSWVDHKYCVSRSYGNYSNGWIVDYSQEICVKDCNPADGLPCANPQGRDPSDKIYDSAKECCERLDWVETSSCLGAAQTVSLGEIQSADTQIAYTLKWYVVYHDTEDPECLQDCASGPDCGGHPEYHDDLYQSFNECCQNHLWWIEDSPCSLLS